MRASTLATIFVCLFGRLIPALAQEAAKPGSDNLVLDDGERLIGYVEHADEKDIVFKSNVIGEVTIKWKNVKELHTDTRLAVIPRGIRMRGKDLVAAAPQGTVSIAEDKLTVNQPSGQTRTMALGDASHIMSADSFERDLVRSAGLSEDWTGTVTAGVSLVAATQSSRTVTTAISLVRAVPPEAWLDKRHRTEVDFTSSYGTVSEPHAPTLKTNIYHASIQRDQYFSPSAYGFAEAAFDHNFSQGLTLQQTYTGGVGWTVISNEMTTLDLKAGVSYVHQQFLGAPDQNLIGSTFSEAWLRKYRRGWTLAQHLNISPAWNNTRALLTNADATFTMPLYKWLNFTFGASDAFLNDPAPGFKKNSFQLTTGVTYTVK